MTAQIQVEKKRVFIKTETNKILLLLTLMIAFSQKQSIPVPFLIFFL